MMTIRWPEISDEADRIGLVVAVADLHQGMQIWGTSVSIATGKAIEFGLLAGALKDHSALDAMCWLSTQIGQPLRQRQQSVCTGFTALSGFFVYGEPFVLPTYSQHGHFGETAFGNLSQVSLDWLETGTDVPFSVWFGW
jgi:hypothetical protein